MIGIMEEIKMGETAKKAILAVSFGTSHSDTRKVTIDAIEEELKAAFEDYPGYALVIGAKCHYQVVACEQLSAN